MAKAASRSDTRKVTFGKRKRGKCKKSYNRHDHTEKNYRSQGR